jgi:hypothetical protein
MSKSMSKIKIRSHGSAPGCAAKTTIPAAQGARSPDLPPAPAPALDGFLHPAHARPKDLALLASLAVQSSAGMSNRGKNPANGASVTAPARGTGPHPERTVRDAAGPAVRRWSARAGAAAGMHGVMHLLSPPRPEIDPAGRGSGTARAVTHECQKRRKRTAETTTVRSGYRRGTAPGRS